MIYYDLQLRKNGVLVGIDWDPIKFKYVENELPTHDLIFVLDDFICLGENVSLYDIALLIKRSIAFFTQYTACPFLDEVIGECLLKEEVNSLDENLSYLELKRVEAKEDEPGGPYFYEFFQFVGKGSNDENYDLHVDLNEVSRFPVILNECVYTYDGDELKKTDRKRKFKLGELIKEIMVEVAFFAPPKTKKQLVEVLQEKHNDKESGISDLINKEMEKQEEKVKDMMEKTRVECIVCGNDSRSPHFGKPEDICISCFNKRRFN